MPLLLHCPSDKAEPWIIADIVEERIAAGVPPEEIAVFTQKNKELPPLYEVLRARKIPVQMTGKVDLLQHPLVCQAISILEAVNTLTDSAIAAAVACACFGCHPADLGRVFQLKRDASIPQPLPPGEEGEDAKLKRQNSVSLYRLLLEFDVPGRKDPVELHDRKAFLHARDVLIDLHQKLPSRTIVETLERVMKDSGLIGDVFVSPPPSPNPFPRPHFAEATRGRWGKGSAETKKQTKHSLPPTGEGLGIGVPVEKRTTMDPLDIAALQEFFDRVKYRAYEQSSFSFEVFMNDLECHRNPDYSDLRMTYDVPHLSEKGVQLLTAHRSKGLEFHTVILANFRDRHWDKKFTPGGVALPEDLLFGWEKDQKAFEKSQDERRVAYVAMTRAKKELIMTCPKELTSGDKLKSVSPSAFFAEAGTPPYAEASGGRLPEEHAEMKDPEKASTLLLKPPREIDAEFRAFLLHRLKNFSLSATALEHFLDDPQKFLELDLLQLPQAKKSEFAYGNAVHDALKKWALKRQEGIVLKEPEFITAFEEYLFHRETLTKGEYARLKKLGEECLPRYYRERLSTGNPFIHSVEYPITVRVNDIPLKGKIDRLDIAAPDSKRATVIDYKTGRPKTENEIRDGSYFRQLTFYALLLEHAMPFLEPEAFLLDFIGEGNEAPVIRGFQIANQQKRDLEGIIEAVWAKVLALDFTPL
ncbi:PD-(D/E)XK nuclease family protein, partial [Candidatus Peregrinibacteria bacterium]|nr:PD-(D/E)XK nuclease family protein [Candidatus Peregrinibacteria bacterium]